VRVEHGCTTECALHAATFWRVSVVLSSAQHTTPRDTGALIKRARRIRRARQGLELALGRRAERLFSRKPARPRALTPAPASAQAFEERTRAAAPKPIERRKVEAKLKEYVRETVRAAHLKRGGVL